MSKNTAINWAEHAFAAAVGFGWLDLGACSVGASHIRQRLYFVADSQWRRRGQRNTGEREVSVSDPDRATFSLEQPESRGR